MRAYKLLKDMPGYKAGAVFVHDEHDSDQGSIGNGCLKNAWESGNSQQGRWSAGTHVLPGQLADDKEWFEEVENRPRYFI